MSPTEAPEAKPKEGFSSREVFIFAAIGSAVGLGNIWHAPLDLVDGAARVYDPIVRGEAGEDLYGVFLKDFEPHPW